MKKLTTILELPIMEILNGKEVGHTRDIVMNLDTKDIAFVLDESIVASLYVIKGEEITGIGRDVVLIKTVQSIQNSQDSPELAKLLAEYYSIIGLSVITTEGNIEGEIIDLAIDEVAKKITDIELEGGRSYSVSQIVSISEKYVFVQEGSVAEEEEEYIEEGVGQEDEEVHMPENHEVEESPSADDENAYLLGMVLSEDVTNEDGTFTVGKGTVLTEELINQAKEFGVLTNLIMNAD